MAPEAPDAFRGPRLRDDLAGLVPYDPEARPVDVLLSANENAYGLPPAVREELARRLAAVPAHRYPDVTCRRLRTLVADLWGVPADRVVVGNGGDELIFNLLLAFGGPGRAMLDCPPSFSAYALYARLTGTQVRTAPRRGDFSLDEGLVLGLAESPDVALVFVTSPNNPSGNLCDAAFVRRLARATNALVVVDEAYGEFADPSASCMPLVAELPNVCVLRTLSKAYALAGARVGYLVAPEGVADGLLAVRQPYSVSRYDQVAAETVLEMRDELAASRDGLVANRAALFGELGSLASELAAAWGRPALAVWPSEANFLLVRVLDGAPGVPSADEAHDRLAREHGVLVRNFSRAPGLAGCLRVTVGTPAENARLLAALRAVLAPAQDRA